MINVNEGSQIYEFLTAGIAATASETIRISEQFPRARIFEPLDYIEIINNSAVSIRFSMSGMEPYTIPSYMIKPFSNKPYREFTLENLDAGVAVAANEIIVHCQRMSKTAQKNSAFER